MTQTIEVSLEQLHTLAKNIDEARDALLSPDFSHTRFIPRFGGQVWIYGRDATSPTGVRDSGMLEVGEFDRLFNELRSAGRVGGSASPLSPTEPR